LSRDTHDKLKSAAGRTSATVWAAMSGAAWQCGTVGRWKVVACGLMLQAFSTAGGQCGIEPANC
jgi:hypothetical protein